MSLESSDSADGSAESVGHAIVVYARAEGNAGARGLRNPPEFTERGIFTAHHAMA